MMNDAERRETANKVIAAVKENKNGAYDKWKKLDATDAAAGAAFVKDVAGLQHLPEPDDLLAMHAHARQRIQPQVEEMRKEHPSAPVVGYACYAED